MRNNTNKKTNQNKSITLNKSIVQSNGRLSTPSNNSNTIQTNSQELIASNQILQKQISELKNSIAKLEKDNTTLKKELTSVKAELETIKQHKIRKSIVVKHLQHIDNEPIEQLVNRINENLEIVDDENKLKVDEVINTRRIFMKQTLSQNNQANQNRQKVGPLIVNLNNIKKRNQLIFASKQKIKAKKDHQSSNQGSRRINSLPPVTAEERLTKVNRKTFQTALQLKDFGFSSVYVFNGKIMYRKTREQAPETISSPDQLEKLLDELNEENQQTEDIRQQQTLSNQQTQRDEQHQTQENQRQTRSYARNVTTRQQTLQQQHVNSTRRTESNTSNQ